MAAEFPELKPAFGFASLEPHKIGGIVIPPREIDDQSIVPLGQFLAMYGAVEFARAEDTWGFLADGSATYENVKGVCQIASENDKAVTLAAGKTKPSDATLVNFRALRTKVSTAALGRGASYYISRSWETVMRSFNSANDLVFVYRPDGTATLDGFPIVWTEVLQPYSDDAAAAKMLAAFGRLDFWWFGERGTPRIDTSAHVFFRNDLLATRFIEEIDFDYCALDAMSVLKTPAA
jgi:HK97 family phage major capsid protein